MLRPLKNPGLASEPVVAPCGPRVAGPERLSGNRQEVPVARSGLDQVGSATASANGKPSDSCSLTAQGGERLPDVTQLFFCKLPKSLNWWQGPILLLPQGKLKLQWQMFPQKGRHPAPIEAQARLKISAPPKKLQVTASYIAVCYAMLRYAVPCAVDCHTVQDHAVLGCENKAWWHNYTEQELYEIDVSYIHMYAYCQHDFQIHNCTSRRPC